LIEGTVVLRVTLCRSNVLLHIWRYGQTLHARTHKELSTAFSPQYLTFCAHCSCCW
jgi:hypothetical protein